MADNLSATDRSPRAVKDRLWTVEINGPHGKKVVCISNEQVMLFNGTPVQADLFATATWLAYCDLWTRDDEPADIQQADAG